MYMYIYIYICVYIYIHTYMYLCMYSDIQYTVLHMYDLQIQGHLYNTNLCIYSLFVYVHAYMFTGDD